MIKKITNIRPIILIMLLSMILVVPTIMKTAFAVDEGTDNTEQITSENNTEDIEEELSAIENLFDKNSTAEEFKIPLIFGTPTYDTKFDLRGGHYPVNGDVYTTAVVSPLNDNVLHMPENVEKDGFVFNGWYSDPTIDTKINGTVKNNVPVAYAAWGHRVHFDANKGVFESGDEDYVLNVDHTFKQTLGEFPVVSRIGYRFLGWSEEIGSEDYITESTITPDKDTTYYANWIPNNYTVIFNGETADEGTVEDQFFTYDESQKLNKNNYSRIGYNYVGWNDTRYSNEKTLSDFANEHNENITDYVEHETLDVNHNTTYGNIYLYTEPGHIGTPTCSYKYYRLKGITTITVPEYAKGTFDYIRLPITYSHANLQFHIYYENGKETIKQALSTNSLNVKENMIIYNYNYDNEYSPIDHIVINSHINYNCGGTFSEWTQWNTQDVCFGNVKTDNNHYDDEQEVINLSPTHNDKITFEPKWKADTYKVTYELNPNEGLTPIDDIENITYYTENETFTLNNPTRPGYDFVGWTSDDDPDAEPTTSMTHKGDTNDIGNKHYTAHWKPSDDTKYVVRHYREKLDGTWELFATDNLKGTTDTFVTPEFHEHEGFTNPEPQEINISGYGNTELEYYYTRNLYKITLYKDRAVKDFNHSITESQVKNVFNKDGEHIKDSNGNNSVIKVSDDTNVIETPADKDFVGEYTLRYQEPVKLSSTETNGYRLIGFDHTGVNNAWSGTTGINLSSIPNTINNEHKDISKTNFTTESIDTNRSEASFIMPANNVVLVARASKIYFLTYDLESTHPENDLTFPESEYTEEEQKEGYFKVKASHDFNYKFPITMTNWRNTYVQEDASFYLPEGAENALSDNYPFLYGYTFIGWNKNNTEEPVNPYKIETGSTGDQHFIGHWQVNNDTKYTVHHYVENIGVDETQGLTTKNCTLQETEYLYGTSDTVVTPEVKQYEGFTSPKAIKIRIMPDGSTTVYYFYRRNKYTVNITKTEGIKETLGDLSGIDGKGTYDYGESVSIAASALDGYRLTTFKKSEAIFTKNFSYTGTTEQYTIPETGWYKLSACGAEGPTNTYSWTAGKGGYVSGYKYFNQDDVIYITVGGQNCFNGGGNGFVHGGDATHFATSNGILSSLENNKESILLVAGGGGAAQCSRGGDYNRGGDGGYYKKVTSQGSGSGSYSESRNASNGTIYEGGKETIANGYSSSKNLNGTFGQGGSGSSSTNGGGGGYYGGGAAERNRSGAGGGSSYFSSELKKVRHKTGIQSGTGYATIEYYGTDINISDEVYELISNSASSNSEINWKQTNWDTTKNYEVKDPAVLSATFRMPAENVELTAHADSIYTIDYDLDEKAGSTEVVFENQRVSYITSDADYTLINPRRVGYDFVGWTEATDDSEPQVDKVLPKGSTGNKHYTAHWKVQTYTVHFDGNNSTEGEMEDQEMIFDQLYNLNANNYKRDGYIWKGWESDVLCNTYGYTGTYVEKKLEGNKTYKVEAWGSNSGYNTSPSVAGGYASGLITPSDDLNIYLYAGNHGNEGDSGGTLFNGGGYGQRYTSNGGGASDIRLINGNWNDFNSLKSRILVAGGAGGSSGHNQSGPFYGGGLNGEGFPSRIATQTSGYGFGYGCSHTNYNAGGGGGYYGGYTNNMHDAGGSGSGFVSGYYGCDAIAEESTENNIIHTGQENHYSGLIFENPILLSGRQNIPNPFDRNTTQYNGTGVIKVETVFHDKDTVSNINFNTENYNKNFKRVDETTLISVWQPKDIFITYHSNADTRTINKEDESIKDKSFKNWYRFDGNDKYPSKSSWTTGGYHIIGWAYDKNATIPDFAVDEAITNEYIQTNYDNDNRDIHLYAVWTPNNYYISFSSDTKNNTPVIGTMENQTLIFDHPQNINKNILTRTGYDFFNWNNEKEVKENIINFNKDNNIQEYIIPKDDVYLFDTNVQDTYVIKHFNKDDIVYVYTKNDISTWIAENVVQNTFDKESKKFTTSVKKDHYYKIDLWGNNIANLELLTSYYDENNQYHSGISNKGATLISKYANKDHVELLYKINVDSSNMDFLLQNIDNIINSYSIVDVKDILFYSKTKQDTMNVYVSFNGWTTAVEFKATKAGSLYWRSYNHNRDPVGRILINGQERSYNDDGGGGTDFYTSASYNKNDTITLQIAGYSGGIGSSWAYFPNQNISNLYFGNRVSDSSGSIETFYDKYKTEIKELIDNDYIYNMGSSPRSDSSIIMFNLKMYNDEEIVNNLSNVEDDILPFHPIWKPHIVTVNYHNRTNTLQGIKEELITKKYAIDQVDYNFKNTEIIRSNARHTGWSVSPDSNEITYKLNDVIDNNLIEEWYQSNEDHVVDLYAVWDLGQYTITYDKNDSSATGEMNTQEMTFDVPKQLTKNEFEKPNYIFSGWKKHMSDDNPENGKVFTYTGKTEKYIIPETGWYKLSAYGAQGQATWNGTGGKGGYISGYKQFNEGDTIYVTVGGQECFNGGGNSGHDQDSLYGGHGGDATHFATENGILSSLENNVESIILVAGGGGAAERSIGGAGGYYKNIIAQGSGQGRSGYNTTGKNGTIYEGGRGMATSGYSSTENLNGTFGQGGSGSSSTDSGPGGGGGIYGGGATTYAGGAGGGSSYFAEDLYDVTYENGVKSGTGRAVIEYVGTKFEGSTGITSEEPTDISYSNNTQVFDVEKTGYYQLSIWGIGPINEVINSDGRYMSGAVYLEQGSKLYIFTGNNGFSTYIGKTAIDAVDANRDNSNIIMLLSDNDMYANEDVINMQTTISKNGIKGKAQIKYLGYKYPVKPDITYEDEETVINVASSENENVVLKAIWTPKTAHVNYHNGDEIIKRTYVVDNNEKYTFKDIVLHKTGYSHTGWTLSSDNETVYDINDDITNELINTWYDSNAEHTVDLNVNFENKPYNVIFNGNGATSGTMEAQAFSYDIAQKLNKNTFEKTNYHFAGWIFKDKEGKEQLINDEAEVSNLSDGSQDNITLTAKWEENSIKIKYHFINTVDGEETESTYEETYNINKPTELYGKHLIYFGHELLGWATEEDLENVKYALGSTTTNEFINEWYWANETHELDLYGVWGIATYTVTFNGNENTSGSMESQQMTYNEPQKLNKNQFERTGYTFEGWNLPYRFDYKDTAQVFVAPEDGTYQIEAYGASGGKGCYGAPGGLGGKASGIVELKKDQVLYIITGQKGFDGNNSLKRTFNGGGSGGSDNYGGAEFGGAGGGATHVASKLYGTTGELENYANHTENLLIVAGGGGGATGWYNETRANGKPGGSDDNLNGIFALGTDGITANSGGGGGGGGYYGGSIYDNYYSGYTIGGAGAGGSSYVADTLTQSEMTEGVNSGDGYVIIRNLKAGLIKDEQEVVNLTVAPNETIQLDAVWKPKSLKVKLHDIRVDKDNNETEEIIERDFTAGEEIQKLLDTEITREGYDFSGWTLEKDSREIFAMNGTSIDDAWIEANYDRTEEHIVDLYAIWIPYHYNIKYISHDATSGEMDDQEVTFDETQTLHKNQFERTGYLFDKWGVPHDYTFTGKPQVYHLEAGKTIKIEAWGAAGGTGVNNGKNKNIQGKGGYASGYLTAQEDTDLYLYVGGQGENIPNDYTDRAEFKGWNGGGYGQSDRADDDLAGSGGGASDIRLVDGNWDNFDSLKSRIMVAGGGAGGTDYLHGSNGGGLSATNINYESNDKIATQTSGYKFGIGQNAELTWKNIVFAGAGGGYYGGYTGDNGYMSSGWGAVSASGGSGFVSGFEGCDAIAENSTENNIIHTGQPNHYSGLVFTNPQLIDGANKFVAPNGVIETGHDGDGFIRIIEYVDEEAEIVNLTNEKDGIVNVFPTWKPKTITVNFHNKIVDADSQTITDDVQKEFTAGQDTELTKDFAEKSGYGLTGWSKTADSTTIDYAKDTKVTDAFIEEVYNSSETHSIDLYTIFAKNNYIIHYDANGGEGEMEDDLIYYDEYKELTPNAFERAGYHFDHWTTSVDETETDIKTYKDSERVKNLKTGAGEVITLYAVWEPNMYNVNFDSNGGSECESKPVAYKNKIGEMPVPVKTGYTFDGWYIDENAITEETEMDASDITVTAHWVANKYTIKFVANTNDESVEDIEMSCEYDKAYTLTANPFTYKGYTFTGWSTKKDGQVSFNDQAEINNLVSTSNGVMTLYAIWAANDYTIVYHTNYDDTTIEQKVSYDTPATLSELARTHYDFAEWNTDKDGNGDSYKAKSIVKNLTDAVDGIVDFFAIWKLHWYEIVYDANGGDLVSQPRTYTIETEPFNLIAPTRKGYTFTGWTTNDNTTPEMEVTVDTVNGGDRTYKANWTRNGYHINYELNKGTLTNKVTEYSVDDENIIIGEPERKGYKFLGWSGTDLDELTKTVTIKTGSVGDRTYTANWEAIVYNISYDLNVATGSTIPKLDNPKETYTVQESFTVPKPERDGYTFKGWTGSNGILPNPEINIVAGTWTTDMEFTANWTPIKYQQTEKYRLENADGTFADYNTIIDEERDFDSTVDAWNRAEDDTYQAASIDSYRVATASEISVDVKRHTSHNTMSYRFENSDGTYSDYEIYADGRYRVGEKISYHYDESDIYEGADAEYTVTREDHVEGVDIKRKSYNITFETDEGEAVENMTEKAGKKIELPSTVKTGYIFTGWYLDADLTQPVTELTVTKDVTLYAGWQAMTGIPYTVNHYKEDLTGEYPATPSEIERFDSTAGKKETPDVRDYEGFTAPKTKTIKVKGDGSSSVDYFYKRNSHKLTLTVGNGIETISEGGTFKYGEEVTVKAVVKSGYVFNGWEGDIESKDAEYTFIMPDKDITMTAMTNADLYTIDYELDDGKFLGTAKTTYTIEDEFDFERPVRYGYEFTNWIDENGDVVTGITKNSSGNKILTAQWKLVDYNISYNLDGGFYLGNTADITINGGNFVNTNYYEVPELNHESTGEYAIEIDGVEYQTLQEAINAAPADGTETVIEINEDINDGSGIKLQAGQNVVINFNGHTYTITNGLVGSKGTETLGMQLLKDSNLVMNDGMITTSMTKCRMLIQRYGDVVLNNMIIDGSKARNCSYVVSSNCGTMIVTGSTQILAYKNKFAFDLYYGMSKVYDDGVAVIFDDNFTGFIQGKVEVGYASRAKNMDWGSKTKLEIDNGTFDVDIAVQNADSNPTKYTVESDEIILIDPVKPGYTFVGWQEKSETEPHTPNGIAAESVEDKEFTAVWSENEYSIEFNLDDGEFEEEADIRDSYTVNSDTYVLPEPVKEGYTFAGWTTDDSAEDPVIVDTLHAGETGDRKYTALWDVVNYDITYEYDGGMFTGGIDVNIGENARFGVNSGYKKLELSSESTGDNAIEIDGEAYDTLQDAINEAPTDGTETVIDINEDIEDGEGFKIQSGQNIVIDFNGHTYNISGNLVGSKGTETCGMQILKDSDVVMRNGKITTSTPKCRILMQRYGNVTLEDMIIDATDGKNCGYAVSSNYGTLTVTGASQIIASEGRYAFDLYYGMSKVYEDGVAVIFDEGFTGYVEGMVEVTKASRIKDTEWGEKTQLTMDAGTFNVEMAFEADDNNPDQYTIEDEFTLNNPVKPNYTFLGWQETEDDEPNDSYDISTGTTGDKHFKAIWESNKTVTLSYNF